MRFFRKPQNKLAEIRQLIEEMDQVLGALAKSLESIHASARSSEPLDEALAQIRLLAVNGSLEASQSPEGSRSFLGVFEEIGQLAAHSREILARAPMSGSGDDELVRARDELSRLRAFLSGVAGGVGSGGDRRAG